MTEGKIISRVSRLKSLTNLNCGELSVTEGLYARWDRNVTIPTTLIREP